jgi:hypothetical protein
VLLNGASGVAINGSWSTLLNAQNLINNNVNWVANGGSLQFDIAAGADPTYAQLVNSTGSVLDLSQLYNQSTMFLWTWLPTGSDFETVTLRWGSSSTDYYTKTVAVTQANTAFQNGWNQLAFEWKTATVVGAPNAAAINYVLVEWRTDGTLQTGVLLNDIECTMGQILNYLYYSKYMFRDAITGAYQETVTDISNLINLDTESYNLLFYQVALLAFQQQQGKNAIPYDNPFTEKQYDDAVTKYKLRYRSQTQKPRSMYYKKPNPSYGWGAAGPWWPRG